MVVAQHELASCALDQVNTIHRMDRFLSALIFSRRAKRKLVQHVGLVTFAVNRRVDRTNGEPRSAGSGQALELI